MPHNSIRKSLTGEEVNKFFDEFTSRLHSSSRANYLKVDEAREYIDAVSVFSNRYDKLLQDYYESVEVIERMAANKGTNLESPHTESYIYIWHFLKELPIIKQRWRRRKKAL